jgi:HSP20 family protein
MREQAEQRTPRDEARREPSLPARRGFRDLERSPFEQLLDDLLGPSFAGAGRGRRAWPAVDVDEDEAAYCVCVEVPGVKREDLDVEIQQDLVTVRGEKRRDESGGRSRWNERSWGSFVRSFSLPPDANTDDARATFGDGVLRLVFPKREQARRRRIEIGDGGSGDGQGEKKIRPEERSAR